MSSQRRSLLVFRLDYLGVLLLVIAAGIPGCSRSDSPEPQVAGDVWSEVEPAAVEAPDAEAEPARPEEEPPEEPKKPEAASAEPEVPATTSIELTPQQIIDAVDDAVVYITAENALGEKVGSGSGCVIDGSGLVATNSHVLAEAATAYVQFREGQRVEIAGYRAVDRKHDLVIVQLQKPPSGMEALPLKAPPPMRQGDPVIAIGHPSDFKFTVTSGIVSAVRKTPDLPPEIQQILGAAEDTLWIQTNAAVSAGSSGGPLLNGTNGDLVGLVTWVGVGQNLGFAVHVQHLVDLYADLSAEASPLPLPDTNVISDANVAAMFADFVREYQQFMLELRTVRDREAAEKLAAERDPVPAYLRKYGELAQQAPDNETKAFEALLTACQIARFSRLKQTNDELEKILDRLRAGYLHDPRTKQVCLALAGAPSVAEAFLRQLLRESDNRDVRGISCFSLAAMLGNSEGQGSQRSSDIVELLRRIRDEFADVELAGEPLGELTERDLFRFRRLTVGRVADEIQGQDFDGQVLRLSDYRGKVVVLDFWAHWCPHCRVMYPAFREMTAAMADQPFVLLGVNSDQDAAQVRSLKQSGTVTWKSWADGAGGPIGSKWQIEAIPTTYVLDPRGVIRAHNVRGDDLTAAVQHLLDEPLLAPPGDLIARGAEWKYVDTGLDPGDAWQRPDFDDSAWRDGAAPLGYGFDIEATRVRFEDADRKPITTCFRKSFEVAEPAGVKRLIVELQVNDGAAVYLNGQEILRDNLALDAGSSTTALTRRGSDWWSSSFHQVDPKYLVPGRNVLAVEVHQFSGDSADLHFDLSLSTDVPAASPAAKSSSSATRAAFCRMQGELAASSEGNDELEQLLADNDVIVRVEALAALLQIDPGRGQSELPAAKDNMETQLRALRAAALNATAWSLVESPLRSPQQLQRGLRLAQAARWLAPEDGNAANTCGVAQYRNGQHRAALTTLQQSLKLQGANPFDLAFVAMAFHGLGERDKADLAMQKLRETAQKPPWSERDDVQAFVDEAEQTIAAGTVAP